MAAAPQGYRGRFAPSPTGPLHAGSLVAALASWLDARAHGGRWLVRLEDVDTPRCLPGADRFILQQLDRLGLASDEPVLWQSARAAPYQAALDRLTALGRAYPCACSRKDIETELQRQGVTRERHQSAVYPGTCRSGTAGRPARAWRFLLDDEAAELHWTDRRLGAQAQRLASDVGDFVLQRADGLWAYQLAVVVDDAAQGITHVVRGEDLADNTPRQIALQQALGLPTPRYLHTPLVRAANGEKLSKQNGAAPLDLGDPLAALAQAAACLDLPVGHERSGQGSLADALAGWTAAWAARWAQP